MRLSLLLYQYRTSKRLNQRDFAKTLGISAATLCRIEQGKEMDGNTLAKILVWMLGSVK